LIVSNKIKRSSLILLLFFLCIDGFLISLFDLNFNFKTNFNITPQVINIDINSDPDQLDDGSYLEGSKITFNVKDNGYSEVQIILTGETRSWILDLELTADSWGVKWDTSEPTPGEEPVPPDTYKITLKIDGKEQDCNPKEIIISSKSDNSMLIVIILIIVIVAVLSISTLFIMKKKRASKASDLEFSTVEKAQPKKKGKVYKGASAIGRQSGQIAEAKYSKKSVGPEVLEPERPISVKTAKPKITKGKSLDITESKGKSLMPPDTSFKFETKPATFVSMMKEMEMKMDLSQKINFLIAKVESTLQNVEFFKAILQQYEQEKLICPGCGREMSKYWNQCPYCAIKEYDSELGLKQSLLGFEDIRFCPDCKRIIKPNWIECPFCFIKK